MERTASSAISESCMMVSPRVQASSAQAGALAGASYGPTPGFQRAIAQLIDEHIRELSVLHGEIAQLRKMLPSFTTGTVTGSGEEGLYLSSCPEHPKPSLKAEFMQCFSNRLADGSSDDAVIAVTGQSAAPKDDIVPNSASCDTAVTCTKGNLGCQDSSDIERWEPFSTLCIYDAHSDAGSQADVEVPVSRNETILSKIASRIDLSGTPNTIKKQLQRSDASGSGSSSMALEARSLWNTGGSQVQQQMPPSSRNLDLGPAESMRSTSGLRHPRRFTDRCVVHPSSSKHASWVGLTTAALAYDLYFIPLTLGFDLSPNVVTRAGNWVTRFLWTMDIPINFCIAYYLPDMETLQKSHVKIGLRYMKSWFLLDACLVSVDWYLSMSGGDNRISRVGRLGKFARFLRFLRMFRLIRAARFGAFFERMLESIVDEAVRLRFITLKIILMMLWLNHFLACGWYLVGSFEINGHPGWTERVPAVTSFFESYSASIQWALTNFGVGSSRLYPETSAENLFAFVTMLFALLIFATLLSSIANGYARMQAARSDEITNMSQLRIYLAQNNVNDNLCSRIIQQAKTTIKLRRSKLQVQNVVLLQFLSPRMNAELQFAVFEKHIELSSLFSGLLTMNNDLMFTLSNEAMKGVHTPGGDVLFYRGQTATHMLLLPMDGFQGTLKYIGTFRVKHISPGRWICEACLWMPWIHMGSLKVSDACEQVQMNAEKFGKVIFEHPDYYESVRDSALLFVKSINDSLLEESSDGRIEMLEVYDTHAHMGYLPGFVGQNAVQISGRVRKTDYRTSRNSERKSWHPPTLVVKGADSEPIFTSSNSNK